MSFSLLDPIANIPVAFLDVETTGASAAFGDRVIEIGIVRVENGRIVERYEQLINPRRPIGPGIVALTGITPRCVEDQPVFSACLERISGLLHGAVLVGHNVAFDLSFLANEFRLSGVDLCQQLGSAQVLDTVRIARRQLGRGGNGLQKLCRRFDYVPDAAHRALADAISTYEIFSRLLFPLGGWSLPLCDVITHQGGPKLLTGTGEPPLPLELVEALEECCDVSMDYVDASGRRTQRMIRPVQIRRFQRELVLVAHCHLRNDRRNFKLDRIVSVQRLSDLQLVDSSRMSEGA